MCGVMVMPGNGVGEGLFDWSWLLFGSNVWRGVLEGEVASEERS
jgi:hypothetical protein